MSTHVVALSGGKDSTALALRLAEVEPREYTYLCTPTGDELPDMLAHWERLECLLGKSLIRLGDQTLDGLIEHFGALPNWRQRWCTRILKIEPCLAYLASLEDPVLYVGLRADEEERQGIYSEGIATRFPLREWGWGLREVLGYLQKRGVSVPKRTDCARCYGQKLIEWYRLWRDHPDIYAESEAQEERTGHTFRSPRRDTWPAPLRELRERFEAGHLPDGAIDDQQGRLFGEGDDFDACRVCRL